MFGHKNSLSLETPFPPPIPGEIAWNKMQTKDVSFKDEKRVTQAECKWEIKRHCIFSQLVSKHCIPLNRCQVKSVQPSVNKLTHLITNNLWTFLSKSNWRWHTAHHPIDFAMVYTATEGEQERVSIRSNVARQKKMSSVLARILYTWRQGRTQTTRGQIHPSGEDQGWTRHESGIRSYPW